jgi:hypothetical protein
VGTFSTIFFVGPSLYYGFDDLEHLADEIWESPAQRGDIYWAARAGFKQIVLIDGRFNQVFSVWHKEILFALTRNIRVIGAASMGAIRAAEMWRYGMIGVGKIFEAYKSGECEDDAWVAMTYDELTNRPLVEAPCGQAQKAEDARAAIALARKSVNLPFVCPFKEDLSEFIEPILSRIDPWQTVTTV